jgi:hypothetical protein
MKKMSRFIAMEVLFFLFLTIEKSLDFFGFKEGPALFREI